MSGSEPRDTIVADVMRRHFVAVSPELSLVDARQLMRLASLRHLIVAREECLVGLISYRRLLESLLDDRVSQSAIASAMVPDPDVVAPSASLAEAADRLCRRGIGCLPVIEQGSPELRLVGVVTEIDLLRAAYRR